MYKVSGVRSEISIPTIKLQNDCTEFLEMPFLCKHEVEHMHNFTTSYTNAYQCFNNVLVCNSILQCMPIIFLTHRSFSVILSSHIGNPSQFASVMTDGPM